MEEVPQAREPQATSLKPQGFSKENGVDCHASRGLTRNDRNEIAAALAPLAMTYRGIVLVVVLAVVVGFGVSLAIEWLQAYLPSRDSSLRDLFANTLGTALGAAVAAWLVSRRKTVKVFECRSA